MTKDITAYEAGKELRELLLGDDVKKLKKLGMINEWISIKDRLPENDIEVLFYDKDVDEIIIGQYDGFWIDIEVGIYDNVTHWMPLPERPKDDLKE